MVGSSSPCYLNWAYIDFDADAASNRWLAHVKRPVLLLTAEDDPGAPSV
jgi:predicted alpha/beta-fold hydrolase